MRILFSTFPGLGHFLPVVPTAWAARGAGHEVLVATAGPALEGAARAGLPAVDARPDFDFVAIAAALREREPAMQHVFSDRALAANPAVVARLYGAWSDRLADRTVETARSWRPDLVVFSPGCAAGPLAAEAVSVPSVLHGLGLRLAGGLTELVVEELRPAFERLAVAGSPGTLAAVLDACPPSMREPGRTPGWTFRAVPYNGGGALPDWLVAPPARPRICVTLGTVVGQLMGVGGLAGVVEAAGELDAEVVLALGDFDLAALGALPANVRTTGWVPFSELLPTCTAIVHHGGAGTTMNALVAGLPQLVITHGPNHASAAAVEGRGVGLVCLPEQATTARVWQSLRRVLDQPGFRAAAQEVRDEIAALPPPSALVARLAALAR